MAKTTSEKIHLLAECAIMIALGTVLSLIKVYNAPYGGSVTLLSMAPMILLSLRRGIKVGLPAAFVYSVLQLILGLSSVAWVPSISGKFWCIILDYILAFTALGLGGIFRNVKFSKNETTNLFVSAILGALLATALRFLCHIISGAVIWYALDLEWYADDPTHIVNRYGAWLFSFIYNGTFMIPEMIETVIGVPLLHKALQKVK